MSRNRRDDYDFPDWRKEETDWREETPAEAADDWELARIGRGPERDRIPPEDRAAAWEEEPARRGRRRGGSNAVLIAVIAVLLLGAVFAAWQLGKILLGYHRDRSAYSELASHAIAQVRPEEAPTVAENEEEAPEYHPVTEVPIQVDWDYLRSVNEEIVGWLYCPGTIINYPVVQTTDNDFYLMHNFSQEYNGAGALFADMNSSLGVLESNFIIYGHNMKDGSMFGSFQSYKNESYADENPILYYLTPDGSYRIDLFAMHIVEGVVENFPTFFSGAAGYREYINEVSPTFYWFRPELMDTSCQLVTLSTCTSAQGFDSARLVLHGVLVPIQ